MSDLIPYIALATFCTSCYFLLGIGVARTQKTFRLITVVLWPLCLFILAITGELDKS